MRRAKVRIASGAIAAALLFSSSVSAQTSAPAQPATKTPASDAWTTLSMLTPAGAIGLGGTAAQAETPSDNPPPPPPPPVYGSPQSPPMPVIIIWLATAATAIYILTRHHHARFFFPVPNSPG
jgi:hypothetical protein